MTKPTGPKQVPFWIKGLGWLAFGILSLATLLVVTRWLVMNNGHQAARITVESLEKKHAAPASATSSSAEPPAAKLPGIPLSALPHFGTVLVSDEDTWKEFLKQLDELSEFIRYKRTHSERVDGVWSCRAVLQNMGVDVPDTMTEEEAAKEYLKRAERFSSLLARWREAVAAGPLEKAADYKSNPDIHRLGTMAYYMSALLALTGEARLRSGDTAGAWEDWQTMKNSTARLAELHPANSGYDGNMDFRMFGMARSGMTSGAWTNDQMAEISSMMARQDALAQARKGQERSKEYISNYYTNFDEHKEEFGKNLMNTPSKFDQLVNQVKLQLITEQQIRDNMAVQLAKADHMLDAFDPETGFYIRPPAEERNPPAATGDEPGIFGSFYFMINDLSGSYGDADTTSKYVIRQQSQSDQFRIAVALEEYQRNTGSYPDNLDAVKDRFPGGLPRDIATGQPYFYQKEPDNGFTLWGTGIDGKSDGGDRKSDVTWKHRPIK